MDNVFESHSYSADVIVNCGHALRV